MWYVLTGVLLSNRGALASKEASRFVLLVEQRREKVGRDLLRGKLWREHHGLLVCRVLRLKMSS
ncbi:hypothetical protein PF005_g22229 [Phytophthora fragariae]|uniref:Uncharacterized protein n=1 Tax=Phytophthora fragariae TaxID=53985 RepID=A0A6A3I8U6_9STRA|nr:hypothetical protein PF003_g37071 [Phytophthora fragariae]KAE8926944.1 hypothetical protein PF009_g22881 [Phytophthora fragariae]KAE8977872.1 hypothetical protein PF011_g23473 [Phytophthora fragariae]KAE9076722.1 hypothetical protein PF010_g23789 [Phytophthora fragariae]KAE9083001.1 hypothetical protein PF007_g22086 [Phytophthora fragariae]